MKSTSIQYHLTNDYLFKEVFINWDVFVANLNKGPDNMKEYLLNLWNNVKENLKNLDGLEVSDINKEVTVDDFNITFNKSQTGVPVYFFVFPDCDFVDASSKYIALAMTKSKPRYFTLEYSQNYFTKEQNFVMGEFFIENNKKTHANYGSIDNSRLAYFAGRVMDILDNK